jgi:hypothetical protein
MYQIQSKRAMKLRLTYQFCKRSQPGKSCLVFSAVVLVKVVFRPSDSVRVLINTIVQRFTSPLVNRRLHSRLTIMTETRITPQDHQPAQRPKRKRGQIATYSGISTSFLSPNQYAVLSDREPEEEEENKIPLNHQTTRPESHL